MFVFLLTVRVAFGVLWEVIEFMISVTRLPRTTRTDTVGLSDTMLDLVFDAIGCHYRGDLGDRHLTDVVGHVETC